MGEVYIPENALPMQRSVAVTLYGMDAIHEGLRLIEEYRDRCLWFLRADYTPSTSEEWVRILDLIERYGDRDGFARAEELKRWLSQPSKAAS